MFLNSTQLAPSQNTIEVVRETQKIEGTFDDALLQKSREFEAVFIGQMLTFSGLDKALTMSGGSDASAFTGMYIQQFAEKIANNGGFGLAEKIYSQMSQVSTSTAANMEAGEVNVYANKL